MTGCLGKTVDGRYPKQPPEMYSTMVKHGHGISTTYSTSLNWWVLPGFQQLPSTGIVIGEVAKVLFANWLACYSRMWGQIEIQRPLASARTKYNAGGTNNRYTTRGNNPVGAEALKIPEILVTTKKRMNWKNASCFIEIHQKKTMSLSWKKWHANLPKWAPNYQFFKGKPELWDRPYSIITSCNW